MNNIFFSVISTQNFLETRQKHVKETWLSKYKNYMFASDINLDDNIKLSEGTDHLSGEEKQLNSFKYVYDNKKGFDWYFFCDDDTFVNLDNLSKFVQNNKNLESFGYVFSYETCPENSYVWSRCGKDFLYYSGGAGFCLRADALEKVANETTNERTRYGDVTSGFLFKQANIQINNIINMNMYTPGQLNHSIQQIKDAISYHFVKDDLMYDLYNFTERVKDAANN